MPKGSPINKEVPWGSQQIPQLISAGMSVALKLCASIACGQAGHPMPLYLEQVAAIT